MESTMLQQVNGWTIGGRLWSQVRVGDIRWGDTLMHLGSLMYK